MSREGSLQLRKHVSKFRAGRLAGVWRYSTSTYLQWENESWSVREPLDIDRYLTLLLQGLLAALGEDGCQVHDVLLKSKAATTVASSRSQPQKPVLVI